jgi:predicted RecB family nuclease
MSYITAAHLYDHIACPHRVWLDQYADPQERDAISPFVQLLWERGTAYEASVIAGLPDGTYLSLKEMSPDQREAATLQAMHDRVEIIYGGRISSTDLLGEPDLLLRQTNGYLAADIKSGRGEEGDPDEEDGKLKPHYAVQVALYSDILNRLGFGVGRQAEVWDVTGRRVIYDLDRPRHTKTSETWWDLYIETAEKVRSVLDSSATTKGALASACKLCHWYTRCRSELTAAGDLTLIPYLGRALRDGMEGHLACLSDFAAADPETFIDGKKTVIPKLGVDRLRLFHERAVLLTDPSATPYLRNDVDLPRAELEIFFDIEADPMNDIVYLHGFVERRGRTGVGEAFTYFFADGNAEEAERQSFAEAIAWLMERPDASVYYYSKYERTMYRKLCEKHVGVCTAAEIEQLFQPPRAVDLYYDVVFRATEWPTNDHSIKTLAKYLGFAWRDSDPSGAASIEWYQRWIESRDPAIRQRILDYNEDDCRATAVLLDGIRSLELRG